MATRYRGTGIADYFRIVVYADAVATTSGNLDRIRNLVRIWIGPVLRVRTEA